jgi:hypothetical protein
MSFAESLRCINVHMRVHCGPKESLFLAPHIATREEWSFASKSGSLNFHFFIFDSWTTSYQSAVGKYRMLCVQKSLLLKFIPCKTRDHAKSRDVETVNAETPQARQLNRHLPERATLPK